VNEEIKANLIRLFERWAEEPSLSFEPLPAHGSDRKYFRIKGKKNGPSVFTIRI